MRRQRCNAAVASCALAGWMFVLIGCAEDGSGAGAAAAGTGAAGSAAGGGAPASAGTAGRAAAGTGAAGGAGTSAGRGAAGAAGGAAGEAGSAAGAGGESGAGGADPGGMSGAGSGGEGGSAGSGEPLAQCVGGAAPPETWQEHWFEHDQLLTRVYYDDCVAIYFDDDMDRDEAAWLFEYMSRIWTYSLATYGAMGEERLFAIFHQGKYGGGHPSYWYDDSHDERNVADQGGNDWSEGAYDVASHEVAHVVESTAPYPRRTSPPFGLWMDSKWAEFYQYDLYIALGMTEHAQTVFDRFTNASDDFPRPGTRWFRDWFYPLWRDHGHAQVMVDFFRLLHEHYDGGGMNWGEYVHFTSGAAGTDLKPLATTAFGWPDEWEQQWQQARTDFPEVTY